MPAVSHDIGTNADGTSEVYAFFAPEVVKPTFRRGPAVFFVRLPASSGKNAPLAWTVIKNRFVYLQVATGANDAASEPPIPVMEADEPSRLKDEDLVSIVTLVRERAVPKATDRYVSEIQPWPIRDIRQFNDEVHATLTDPSHDGHFQEIRLQKASGQWAVVELTEVGRRPRK